MNQREQQAKSTAKILYELARSNNGYQRVYSYLLQQAEEPETQIEQLEKALFEIGGAAAQALLENNVKDWSDGGPLGDALINIKDIVETYIQEKKTDAI